jgi:hypothetical protein
VLIAMAGAKGAKEASIVQWTKWGSAGKEVGDIPILKFLIDAMPEDTNSRSSNNNDDTKDNDAKDISKWTGISGCSQKRL